MSTNVMEAKRSVTKVRTMTQIGLLSAIAVILMLFEIPLPFAPAFYKIDFSEVPVLLGAFTMGPLAGVAIEFIKILLNFAVNGTITAGVGELANFLIGVAFVVPAAVIYRRHKTRKTAVIGMICGALLMTALGCFLNAYILLPAYAKAFSMPIDALVGMGSAVNSGINSMLTFVLFAVVPFNLLKGALVSLVVFVIYKKVSPILKGNN
ncbi:ECF transporter S component [Lachnospiraceae bacterium OttesenSCG-928-J05]|nr:ECF transporter S component [Lachnospiraceae bacterium OttesenSCG-928-J05]